MNIGEGTSAITKMLLTFKKKTKYLSGTEVARKEQERARDQASTTPGTDQEESVDQEPPAVPPEMQTGITEMT